MLIEGISGEYADVNEDNQMEGNVATRTEAQFVNRVKEQAYTALFSGNPDGAGDVIFYLKNQAEEDLIITGILLATTAAEEVTVTIGQIGTAVKTNGADLTPANLNAGSNKAADMLCHGSLAAAAVDITGLSGGSIIAYLWLTSAASTRFAPDAGIVIPKGQTFSLTAIGGDTDLHGSVEFYFRA